MQSIKEHNLKANHNSLSHVSPSAHSVCNLSKNTIWKQITTTKWFDIENLYLYAIYQRTQSESKSQLLRKNSALNSSVCNLSKNTIWKQITTPWIMGVVFFFLYAIYQRTQSESKSQPLFSGVLVSLSVCNLSKNTIWKQITTEMFENNLSRFCMQSIKEHNLKANHNLAIKEKFGNLSVCNLSKNTPARAGWNKSESKSQLIHWWNCSASLCMQSIKEHNLKANHNSDGKCHCWTFSVCNLSKNTPARAGWNKSESKSQRIARVWWALFVCMQSIKEHNLKANHNLIHYAQCYDNSVCNLSKNTPARAGWNKSESKSQPNI